MFGTGKGAATAKPRPEKKPKPVSKAEQKLSTTLRPTAPEQVSAMNRVKRLTTKPDEWSPHDTQMQYVHDTLNHGVNAVEDRGDVSRGTTARMYGKLHQVSLHLNEHAKQHSRGNYGDAAAHLELAAKELTEVGSTLGNHLGTNVTHGGDNQTYPISFMKTHATTLANHYRTNVAGIAGPTAQVRGRDYEAGPELRIPELKSGKAEDNTRFHMSGRVPAGYGLLSDSDSSSTRSLNPTQMEKFREYSSAKPTRSIGAERLASLPPKMTIKDHIKKAYSDLETKGKIHKTQYAALQGKVDSAGNNVIDRLHELTGVEKPIKAGTKMSGTTQTPSIRDREVK
jgi:hypothetical protein